MELRVVGEETDDDQRCVLGALYRLDNAAMPFGVWNGEKFVGPRERFHLRLLEGLSPGEIGGIEYVGEIPDGILLVPEIERPTCLTCDWDLGPDCVAARHKIVDDFAPNRELLAAIDVLIAPWLEVEAEARCAEEVEAILVRAFRWEGNQGYPYVATPTEEAALRRRLAQDPPVAERDAILKRFPNLTEDDSSGG